MPGTRKTLLSIFITGCLGSGAVIASDHSYWLHPGNARAAASCANLFADAGDVREAAFFADLAGEEDLSNPNGGLARARVAMLRGNRIDSEVQRIAREHPSEASRAAAILLSGAEDLLEARKGLIDVALAVQAAIRLDPSVRPAARGWAFDVVRTQMTPRHSRELLVLLGSAASGIQLDAQKKRVVRQPDPEIVQIDIDVATRALAMGWPRIAAAYATHALQFATPQRPRLARILIDSAQALLLSDRPLASYCVLAALAADASLKNDEEVAWLQQASASCGRGELLRDYLARFPRGRHVVQAQRALRLSLAQCVPTFGLGGGCGNIDSPFWGPPLESDQRFFPAAIRSRAPLPRLPIAAAAFKKRAAECTALAPPLFPEPFIGNRIGVQAEERIHDPDNPYPTDHQPPPCVENSTWEIVVASDGHVESARIIAAHFQGEQESAKALAADERRLLPVLRNQRYRPARIRGVAVRSTTRVGIMGRCEP